MTERQLMDGIGLPESNMRAVAQHLKTFKIVPKVIGLSYEWLKAGSRSKKRKREDANTPDDRSRHQEWRGDNNQGGMIPHSETHPFVQEMMEQYYKQFPHIMGRQICHKAGTTIHDLNIGNACLNYILGKCNRPGCTQSRWHPNANDVEPREVMSLCNKVRRGVNRLTQAQRNGGSGYDSSDGDF